MSFSHKAFEFHWVEFEAELLPLLQASLESGDPEPLVAFVTSQPSRFTDPYEGEQLSPVWANLLEVGDVHEIGDFALTKYYAVRSDHGLGSSWIALEATLSAPERSALLGHPLGGAWDQFDPGKMGSYFRTPDTVEEALSILPARAEFAAYLSFLNRVAHNQRGVYITF